MQALKLSKTTEDSGICELKSNVFKNYRLRALDSMMKASVHADCITGFLHIVENYELWIQVCRLQHMWLHYSFFYKLSKTMSSEMPVEDFHTCELRYKFFDKLSKTSSSVL